MELKHPFLISSRLLPAIKVEDCTISMERLTPDSEGRWQTMFYFDFDDGREFTDDKLKSGASGVGGGTQKMFGSLFSFLGAAAESRQYRERTGREGENEDIFCPEIVDWASHNSDELACMSCEIEETEGLIID